MRKRYCATLVPGSLLRDFGAIVPSQMRHGGPMKERFTHEHVETWRRDGCVLIKNFFTADEVAGVCADFATVFGRVAGAAEAMQKKKPGELGRFNPAQFTTFEAVPFDCSPALNLIGVHPALVSFAK